MMEYIPPTTRFKEIRQWLEEVCPRLPDFKPAYYDYQEAKKPHLEKAWFALINQIETQE